MEDMHQWREVQVEPDTDDEHDDNWLDMDYTWPISMYLAVMASKRWQG
jgi:hypothetical protein